jgi:4'-phosphopantetheinyl transferase
MPRFPIRSRILRDRSQSLTNQSWSIVLDAFTIGVVLVTDMGETVAGAPEEPGTSLPRNQVHVWRDSLTRRPEEVARLRGLLAPDEHRRADRYRFERHRSRYIVGRATLRLLLAHYLDAEPAELEISYGEFDKPYLTGGPSFNISHSGTVVLYAFAAAGELGIDVELYDTGVARERIAERFFSPTEVSVLRSLPADVQPWAFLTCWTRKEAFIKARGDGLNLALDSFDVTLAPEAPAALLRTAWCHEEPEQWRLEDLSDRRTGYIAAVALRGNGWRVVERKTVDTIEGQGPGQE